MAARADVSLDRELQNSVFESWKLGSSSFLLSSDAAELPEPTAVVDNTAVDYLHTRAAVLRNHLIHSKGRLFAFTCPSAATSRGSSTKALLELVSDQTSALGLAMRPVCCKNWEMCLCHIFYHAICCPCYLCARGMHALLALTLLAVRLPALK